MLDFQKIRRKQKWLFGLIAIPVIFGFVILFTPDAEDRLFGRAGQAESGSYGQLDDEIVTRSQWLDAQNIIIGQYGRRLPDEVMDNETVRILRERSLMRHYGISPSQADSDAWISQQIDRSLESLPVESRPTRQEWLSNLFLQFGAPISNRGDSEYDVKKKGAAQIESFARHQVGTDQLRRLSGLSGVLLSAKEAEIQYRERNEQYEAEGIFLAHTNYLPLVQASEEQLKQHYTNTLASHIVPPRRQMSYVTFPATNYLDEAEKKFDALNAVERNGFLTNYWAGITDLAGYKTNTLSSLAQRIVPARTNEYAGMKIEESTADIREKILTLPWGLKAGLASVEAYKAGVDFRKSLEATQKAQPALDTLEKMALLQNLTARTTQAITNRVNGTVPELPGVALGDLFQLTVTNAFIVGDSFSSGSGDFFIASLKRIIPSRKRSFAEAKSIVTAGYKKTESIKLMKQAGEKVDQSIKAGKSLAEVAKENNLMVVKLGPFNSEGGAIPGLANKANSEDFRTQALGLEVGAASGLISSSTDPSDPVGEEAAFIVKLTSKSPMSKEKFDAGFADYLENERTSAVAQAYRPWLQRHTEDSYKYSLSTGVEEGEGTIMLEEIDGEKGFYKQETLVKIVAKPGDGHEFKEWTNDLIDNTNVADNEIVVSRNMYISASFTPKSAK